MSSTMTKCSHENIRLEWVTFKNNTRHIQIICNQCQRHRGYQKQRGIENLEIKQGTTTNQKRTETNKPVGTCLVCEEISKVRITGCCESCQKEGFHRPLKLFSSGRNKKIWELDNDDLLEFRDELFRQLSQKYN